MTNNTPSEEQNSKLIQRDGAGGKVIITLVISILIINLIISFVEFGGLSDETAGYLTGLLIGTSIWLYPLIWILNKSGIKIIKNTNFTFFSVLFVGYLIYLFWSIVT